MLVGQLPHHLYRKLHPCIQRHWSFSEAKETSTERLSHHTTWFPTDENTYPGSCAAERPSMNHSSPHPVPFPLSAPIRSSLRSPPSRALHITSQGPSGPSSRAGTGQEGGAPTRKTFRDVTALPSRKKCFRGMRALR